jgi:hypothetical protein
VLSPLRAYNKVVLARAIAVGAVAQTVLATGLSASASTTTAFHAATRSFRAGLPHGFRYPLAPQAVAFGALVGHDD